MLNPMLLIARSRRRQGLRRTAARPGWGLGVARGEARWALLVVAGDGGWREAAGTVQGGSRRGHRSSGWSVPLRTVHPPGESPPSFRAMHDGRWRTTEWAKPPTQDRVDKMKGRTASRIQMTIGFLL